MQSGIKLMKLVYTPINVSFLKTLVTNLSFSRNIFTSGKESDPQSQLKISCSYVFCLYIQEKIVHVLVY